MKNIFGNLALTMALSVAAVAGFSTDAKAYDDGYCREYTRTVYIGGRSQDAYGTACLQQDGSWMVTGENLNNDIPYNGTNVEYVIHDNRRNIIPPRVVYYPTRPVVNVYRSSPLFPAFVWYKGGHYDRGRHNGWNNNRRDWDRRHDNRRGDHDRGRGRDRH